MEVDLAKPIAVLFVNGKDLTLGESSVTWQGRKIDAVASAEGGEL